MWATLLAAPMLAQADSACWREPLLIGQRMVGLVKAYQLWERPRQGSGEPRAADEPPLANAIPSFDAGGRRGVLLTCSQIRTWVNERETVCSGDADQDDGTLWTAAIEGPVGGRVRVPLKAGGSAWVGFRPDHTLPDRPVADLTLASASLARNGMPGQLVVSTNHRLAPTLRLRPEIHSPALAWTSAQEAVARAFATRAAPDRTAPGEAGLTPDALSKQGQWQMISQVVQTRRNSQGEWWRVQQWLQPMESVDPGAIADGRTVLALDESVRSATLRQGWVRHRDTRGLVRAVITDGAACD